MITSVVPVVFLWIMCTAEEFYYHPMNISRTTQSGIAAYRSALTLDWLAAEDTRQRELVAAFESDLGTPSKVIPMECIAYPRPAAGKVARLMLELLKNLEGDDGVLVPDLIQALVRSKLLVLETAIFEAEPDLEALVKTPGEMIGEPHITFPRILAMIWMTITDPAAANKQGWCPITKVNKYLLHARASDIAKNMRALSPAVSRARFIMEEFIQHVTPLNMMPRTSSEIPERDAPTIKFKSNANRRHDEKNPVMIRPVRTHSETLDDNNAMYDMMARPQQSSSTTDAQASRHEQGDDIMILVSGGRAGPAPIVSSLLLTSLLCLLK